jgi:ferredoxin
MGTIIYDVAGVIRVQGVEGILEIIDDDCIECELCVPECPYDALYLKSGGVEVGGYYTPKFNQLTFVPDWCTGCGECVAVCAVNALRTVNVGGGGGMTSTGQVFGDYGDGESNPPGTGPGPGPDCGGKGKAKTKITNPKNKTSDDQLRNKIQPGGAEWGANQRLNSLTAGDFKNTTITTLGMSDAWLPEFTWDSVSGYTTGFSHIHTDGTAPSPQDAFYLLKNLDSPQLANASAYEKEFYKLNASFTLISSSGYEYVVTVADWDLFKKIYDNRFVGKENDFNNSYNTLADLYKSQHPGASEAEATEYAFKAKLGNSISFYRKKFVPTSTGDLEVEVEPLQLQPVINPSITQIISPIGCI